MAIRASVKADFTAFDGAIGYLDSVKAAGKTIIQGVERKHEEEFLQPLHTLDPGPSQHGAGLGAWSTRAAADAKARRWWFANYPDGYTRTGKLAKDWRFRVQSNPLKLVLENANPAAVYVFSFADNPRARGGRPNPGHIRTGWPQAGRKAGVGALEKMRLQIQIAYERSLQASIANGKFTVVIP